MEYSLTIPTELQAQNGGSQPHYTVLEDSLLMFFVMLPVLKIKIFVDRIPFVTIVCHDFL